MEDSSIVDESGEGCEPLCARIESANREVSEGKAHFSSTKAPWSGERARYVGLFHACTGLWTAGCWLARRLHQLKASTTMGLGISFSLIFVRCVALRNLELLIKTGWNVFNSIFARLGTDYEIRNHQWFFAILEAMTSD